MLNLITGSRLVSLFKTLSWRIIATITTIALAYLFTGDISTALKIGSFEFVAKMALYYLHERAWVSVTSRGVVDVR